MTYHFKTNAGGDVNSLIFCKQDVIFELNFEKEGEEQIKVIYEFKTPLKRQPLFFHPNKEQNKFMIASPEDGCYLNLSDQREANIIEAFAIASIQ